MLETALLLLLAHLLGDYLFQTNTMVARKPELKVLGLHIAIHGALYTAVLWQSWGLIALLTASHFLIDWIKINYGRDEIWSYLADQTAHLGMIAVILALGATSPWAVPDEWLKITVYACGLIITTLAIGPIIGYVMRPYAAQITSEGLENAGKLIGQLERALIFILILVGAPSGIGFLIAAKSVLRYNKENEQKFTEYVIIGTLASFGLALATSYFTVWSADQLFP
ncbi:MAG: DUF3307 domain-containing protein [Pseudomonadota bacterium]